MDPEEETDGVLRAVLATTLAATERVLVLAAHVPDVPNRATHLSAIGDALADVALMVDDLTLLDPPEEEGS